MSQFYTLLTDIGQAKLANAMAVGEPFSISELAVGDGGGSVPTIDASATALVNEVRRAQVNRVETDADNPNWLVVEQVLPPSVGGWYIREVGVFDEDGDLIAIGNYPETYKPQLSEGSSRTQTVRFVMMVSDTSAITLKVDPGVVLATRGYVDDEIDEHAKSRNHPAATTSAKGLVELATPSETKNGSDNTRAVTPAGNKSALDAHRGEAGAHAADRISLDEISQAPEAKNVQAALAAIGAYAGEVYQNVAVFDSPGISDWMVPEPLKRGLRQAHVTVVGGGGGGDRNDVAERRCGGSAGGAAIGIVDLSSVSTVSVTVGEAGRGQTPSSASTSGGSSSFGQFLSATGGSNPSSENAGGPGGMGIGGYLNIRGGSGSDGVAAIGGGGSGDGGDSIFGGAGRSFTSSYSAERNDGGAPGAGGGGTDDRPSQAGAGAPGIVIVRW